MDAISDRVFTETQYNEASSDEASLLTVILDISPRGWYNIKDQITIQEVTKSLLVFLNSHLSLNNSNIVAFIASTPNGSKFLYPNPDKNYDVVKGKSTDEQAKAYEKEPTPTFIDKDMYRQFSIVDETVLEGVNGCIEELSKNPGDTSNRSSLSGALSMALTYTNRMLTLDQSISTTTASAINSTTNMTSGASSVGTSSTSGGAATTSLSSMRSRLLIVSANDDDDIKYIPIMNSIFAAQKMKLSIDVANLGKTNSSFLQQAADATKGIYLNIENPQGLIQVLSTAFFMEPSIRQMMILPTNSNVDYKASCFITGKSVDLGYVCSVCLCIMGIIPEDSNCPTCGSKFNSNVLTKLRKGPQLSIKKRKLDSEPVETP